MIDLVPSFPPAGRPGSRLQVTVDPVGRVVPGVPFEVTLRLTVAAGHHAAGHEGGEAAVAKTVARVRPLEWVESFSQEWRYPPAEAGGYRGCVVLVARCTVPAGTAAGPVACRVIVEAQVCSDALQTCYAPEQVTAEFLLELEG